MDSRREQVATAWAERRWRAAHDLLVEARHELDAEGLESLAVVSYLLGRDDEAEQAWAAAHQAFLSSDQPDGSARCAYWIGMCRLLGGDSIRASGWFGRARRIVEEHPDELAAEGYLLVVDAFELHLAGDHAVAASVSEQAVVIGQRFGDPDLLTLGRLGVAEARVAAGDGAAFSLLDELMITVTTEDLSPITAGIVYCAVLEACMAVHDVARAGVWTDELRRWCAAQPDLVPYRGVCLVHRSQVLQARGHWDAASDEAELACRLLAQQEHPALGEAELQRAEMHRVRGDRPAAERAYAEAARHGRDVAAGLALLRLDSGDVEGAVATVRRALREVPSGLQPPALLAVAVEVLLAADLIDEAAEAAHQLLAWPAASEVVALAALADRAEGAVLLARGRWAEALGALRRSCRGWHDLDMPYELARTKLLAARACEAAGDAEGGAIERRAAVELLEGLGAGAELSRLTRSAPSGSELITRREAEVLGLIAQGCTNREIAADLVISEHTVARHVQNILAKLGVSSRTAAAAWAFEHDLA